MSDLLHLLHGGVGWPDVALTANRMVLGAFFAISGYHKLFNRERHRMLVETLTKDCVPLLAVNQWLVPTIEFGGGLALLIGFLAPLASVGLLCVCSVATCVDGLGRIPTWRPLDAFDWVDDVLYLPEVLYAVMLLGVIFGGSGPLSVDALLLNWMG